MAFDLPLWKINTGQQVLSFLEPKIWTKFSNSTRNAKTGFLHTYSKEILSWRNFKKTVQVNKLVCIQNKRLKQFSLFILVSPSFNTTYAFIINFAWLYFNTSSVTLIGIRTLWSFWGNLSGICICIMCMYT